MSQAATGTLEKGLVFVFLLFAAYITFNCELSNKSIISKEETEIIIKKSKELEKIYAQLELLEDKKKDFIERKNELMVIKTQANEYLETLKGENYYRIGNYKIRSLEEKINLLMEKLSYDQLKEEEDMKKLSYDQLKEEEDMKRNFGKLRGVYKELTLLEAKKGCFNFIKLKDKFVSLKRLADEYLLCLENKDNCHVGECNVGILKEETRNIIGKLNYRYEQQEKQNEQKLTTGDTATWLEWYDKIQRKTGGSTTNQQIAIHKKVLSDFNRSGNKYNIMMTNMDSDYITIGELLDEKTRV